MSVSCNLRPKCPAFFMCCAKADGLQPCVQSKFLEPLPMVHPRASLGKPKTARLNICSIWQRQGQYPSFMGENGWVLVLLQTYLWASGLLMTIEHPTQARYARFSPFFGWFPLSTMTCLGGLLNCDALSWQHLPLFTGYRYIFLAKERWEIHGFEDRMPLNLLMNHHFTSLRHETNINKLNLEVISPFLDTW